MIQLFRNRLLRLQRWINRAVEDRIYSDEGAIRFQLPKGLDPRDQDLWERGQRLNQLTTECAQDLRQRLRAERELLIIQEDYDTIWSYFL